MCEVLMKALFKFYERIYVFLYALNDTLGRIFDML